MKKRIISFILCMAMCCAIFPATALAAAPEPQYEENLTSELMAAFNPVSPMAKAATGNYENSTYHWNLYYAVTSGYNGTKPTGHQRDDIVLIAKSQLNYHEGGSVNDIDGKGTSSGNYTEYGRVAGNNGAAWGGYFIYWLGLQVGCSQNLMWLSTKPYDSNNIEKGDIVIMRNGENRGIVSDIKYGYIYIIEGNYSDRVKETAYPLNTTDITGYVKPNYVNWSPRLINYAPPTVHL